MSAKCNWCSNTNNLEEVYTEDDDKKYICPSCLKQEKEEGNVGFCQLCNDGTVYEDKDLDKESLCRPVHKGEFNYSEEETKDMEDYVEYHTKDG